MSVLDDLDFIKRLDKDHCLESIRQLPTQIIAAWQQVQKINFTANYKDVSAVIFCGMGGSGYGGRIIKSLYYPVFKKPLFLVNDYNLPGFADKNSLIIASSYSGNTEETLNCVKEGLNKGLKIIGITTGGQLAKILKSNNMPLYNFVAQYNPSNQPRLGQGYMQMGQMAILSSIGLLSLTEKDIGTIVKLLQKNELFYRPQQPIIRNKAKKIAQQSKDKIINLVGAEFIQGALYAVKNPINETGKHFANYFNIPEMNHYLLEGLSHPSSLRNNTVFIFIKSQLYSKPVVKRLMLTDEVVRENNIDIMTIELSGQTKLEQVYELIQLGNYISFYLAMIHNINPAPVPWVDYFKNKLS